MIFNFKATQTMRLDKILQENLPLLLPSKKDALTNSKIRRLIIASKVFVDNKKIIRPAFEVLKNSIIKIDFDESKFFYEKPANDIKYEVSNDDILFEDDDIIIVNKKSFFPVEATIVGNEKRDNLHDALVRYLWKKNPALKNPPYIGIMHRLDKQTSGAILFTKTRSVNSAIHDMFENHEIRKIYKVLCSAKNENEPKNDFTIEKYIQRISPKSSPCKWGIVSEKNGGLYSKTHFHLLKKITFNGVLCFLLEAELFTGRTHQIRVHLSSEGLPVVGDELYGGIKANRIMLHSERLEFVHPITLKKLIVTAVQ